MTTRTSSRRQNSTNGKAPASRTVASTNGRAAPRVNGRVPAKTNGRASKFPSQFVEEEGEADLRATASARSDRAIVKYSADQVRLELAGRGNLFIDGLWDCVVSVDGQPYPLTGEWESSCWNADEDADYLELQFRVGDALRIDRQILLPRAGNFAVLADAVMAPAAKELEVRTRMALAAGIRFDGDRLTRSAKLRNSAGTARIHPLGLPQEKIHSTSGQLNAAGGVVELVQRQAGNALYAPLVIDWSPKRAGVPVIWRKLTVSEYSRVLRHDEAAGYRLQASKEQWLIYHSLHNNGEARAVLGHHTWHETVIGPMKSSGMVEPLIEIEAPE